MLKKISQSIANLHRGEKGMTGLETAIILIAFVMVASVLAYSVLSADIFAAERGKETVYKGLEQAQSSMKVKGSVLGLSSNQTELESIQFNVGLAVAGDKIDTSAIVINYWDEETHSEGLTYDIALATGCTERGAATMLEGDEQFTISVTLPDDADIAAYKKFSVQLLPPTGASLTITRSLPGSLSKSMDLH